MNKNYNGYLVNSAGIVYSKRSGKPLKGKIDKDGYIELCLSYGGKVHYERLHRIIASCFVDNPDAERNNVVNHLDGNKLNNDYSNLEWTTVKGNTKHAYDNGWLQPPNTSKETEIINTETGEVLHFSSRKECEKYFGADYRTIVGSRQAKRFQQWSEVKKP